MENPVELRIELINKKPKNALQCYNLYQIDTKFNENEKQNIIQLINESKIVFIDTLDDDNNIILIELN